MKSLHTSMRTVISGCTQALSCHPPHILSKSFYSSPYISPLPPPLFYRPIPIHPHSYAPDAQTTSICNASPHQPHSAHPEDCTNPLCISSPSAIPHTSISPSSIPSSPDYADLLSSSPRFQFHNVNALWTQALHYIFPFMWYDAPRAVRIEDNSLTLAQTHLTLALAASSTPSPAPSVLPK